MTTGDSIYRHTVAGHSEPSEISFAEHMSGISTRILGLAGTPSSFRARPCHNRRGRTGREPVHAHLPRRRLAAGAARLPGRCGRSASGRPSSFCSRSTMTAAAKRSSGFRRSAARSSLVVSSTPLTASPGRLSRRSARPRGAWKYSRPCSRPPFSAATLSAKNTVSRMGSGESAAGKLSRRVATVAQSPALQAHIQCTP